MSFRLLPVVVSRRPARLAASVGAALACLLVAGATAPTATAAEGATVAQATAPSSAAASIAWQPCRDGFQCALLPVPLDYDNPRGPQITVSVIRLPAADPARRIGSLFLNPGGPGGSGVDIVRGLGQFLPLELRGRFDIVGFDPRGIFRSTPLRCYNTFDEAIADLPPIAFPVTRAEEEQWRKANVRLASACQRHGGAILRHMSTADAARDMDRIRQAVGDSRLNFLGYSYGSMLGQTYANLFPSKVRAVVIDGVLDPRAWVGQGAAARSVPVGARVNSDIGSMRTLNEFFRLCDAARKDCDFSGNAKKRYDALAKRLKAAPLTDPQGNVVLTYADLIAITAGVLYAPFIWPFFASFLRDIEREASAAVRQHVAQIRRGLGLAEQEPYPNFIEGGSGVMCADSTNPRDFAAYRTTADKRERLHGYFGRMWTYFGSECHAWPQGVHQDRYTGPWTARTAKPVLVVGNRFDPATPYSGAVAASKLLPNSRLLTYTGWGHTAFFTGNFCVDVAVTDYLVTTRTPPAGATCRPAGSPFGQEAAAAVTHQMASTALAPTLPGAVRRALD